jgi:hypothetical protein
MWVMYIFIWRLGFGVMFFFCKTDSAMELVWMDCLFVVQSSDGDTFELYCMLLPLLKCFFLV